MPLSPGTRLGSYDILGPLGKGGMGEVYRARDTKLNRDVAIKILPELFALERERITRFGREAQLLAALNHSHIAQIYGVEDTRDGHALVMELVPGQPLSELIPAGACRFRRRSISPGRSAKASKPRTTKASSIAT